jgi:hypothetical protein
VDGSGEFGAFEDDLAAVERAFEAEVGRFDERGQLVGKERRVRYYSHREARGVDSKMDDDTVGFVVLSARSRYNDAAQAVYRLRGLAKGQKVRLVVARDGEATPDFPLVEELVANEQEHAESAESVLEGQLAHAARKKSDAGSFERKVTIYTEKDPDKVEALRTAEKQQHQQQHKTEHKTQTRVEVREGQRRSCFHSGVEPGRYHTLANSATTEISQDLEALRVSLSPFLTYTHWTNSSETRRRAFAVYWDGEALEPRLVVMALAEVWTRYGRGQPSYVAYSHDGVRLRGEEDERVPEGMMLFGRYLCDDQLSLLAEYQLLSYLRQTYKDKAERGALTRVVLCLWDTLFLRQPTKLLHHLAQGVDKGAGMKEGEVLAEIRKDMFGGVRALDPILTPYVSSMYAAAAFGTRRFV